MAERSEARDRLRTAALDLFREHGFERTTAAAIASRAGVTERTFFRHFADKREVLFDGEPRVRAALTGPLDTLLGAFRAFQPMLEEGRSYARPRQDVISSTPALRERELAKLDALADALAAALRARSVPDARAALAARIGMAAFTTAAQSWLDDPAVGFGERIDLAFRDLRALLADG